MHPTWPCIDTLRADAYRIPTEVPEADGTYEWSATTIVVVHVSAAGRSGIGYSYTDAAAAALITDTLCTSVVDEPALDVPRVWGRLLHRVRNLGRSGLCATAISAIDAALWDLKAQLLDVSLLELLGAVRDRVPVYGSGGFTSYDDDYLVQQLARWVDQGICRVKMKVGRDPKHDIERVRRVHRELGSDVELFVDANGAYGAKQAIHQAEQLATHGVLWLEEPVSSDDLDGLCLVRSRAPASLEIAAGEYGYDDFYFLRMLEAGAIDVLQADATRCCGLTGFLRADVLAAAHHIPLSSHCAPALHAAVCCASDNVRHMEYFHDHVRIERMLFDGAPEIRDGQLFAQRDRPGCGFTLRGQDVERFRL